MNNENHQKKTRTISTENRTRKKPYQPPEILTREPLEAMAAVCGDEGGKSNPGTCPTGPIGS